MRFTFAAPNATPGRSKTSHRPDRPSCFRNTKGTSRNSMNPPLDSPIEDRPSSRSTPRRRQQHENRRLRSDIKQPQHMNLHLVGDAHSALSNQGSLTTPWLTHDSQPPVFVPFESFVVPHDSPSHRASKYPSIKPKGSEKTPYIFGIFGMFTHHVPQLDALSQQKTRGG